MKHSLSLLSLDEVFHRFTCFNEGLEDLGENARLHVLLRHVGNVHLAFLGVRHVGAVHSRKAEVVLLDDGRVQAVEIQQKNVLVIVALRAI